MGELKKVFRPEFLNRIDDVIVFHKLQKDEIKQIVDLLLLRIRASLAERELQLELSEAARTSWSTRAGTRDGRPSAAPGDPALHRGSAGRLRPAAEVAAGSTVMVDRAPRATSASSRWTSSARDPAPVAVGWRRGREEADKPAEADAPAEGEDK
jgi:ATP-dependent Clp protease ATP-binding subunit ClpC